MSQIIWIIYCPNQRSREVDIETIDSAWEKLSKQAGTYWKEGAIAEGGHSFAELAEG